ncbi:MAG: PadR family transcriptional regulator [Anaerococcus sp.]|jgi:PadR family transcriptional regulator PadR|nr:PadR family transcriptional regulator [Peptoniphilaceae bacterium]MDY3055242.1 PadR family transcriptional regulator [Anaerococcus sp.]
MIDSQMLKGIIDGIILEIISKNQTYGYEIVEELKRNGFYNMTEGTVYPILKRLTRKGYLMGTFRKSEVGPKRKYYYITEKGEKKLSDFKSSYSEMTKAVDKILYK